MDADTPGTSAISRDDLEWALQRLRERAGDDVRIAGVTHVASRQASVCRLQTTGAPDLLTCYLKLFTPEELSGGIAGHFDRMTDVATRFAAHPSLLPLTILGLDAGSGRLLTRGVPGTPLSGLRRAALTSVAGRAQAERAWRGVGRWLAHLHTARAESSATQLHEVADQAAERLRAWRHLQPSHGRLCARALDVLDHLGRHDDPVAITYCHGDVSTGNVMVDETGVGLIDFDDLRIDLAGIDVSQAVLAIAGFSAVGPLRVPGLASRLLAAFSEGYGPLPEGPAIVVAHIRNLSVALLTIARVPKREVSAAHRADAWRFRRELARIVRGSRDRLSI